MKLRETLDTFGWLVFVAAMSTLFMIWRHAPAQPEPVAAAAPSAISAVPYHTDAVYIGDFDESCAVGGGTCTGFQLGYGVRMQEPRAFDIIDSIDREFATRDELCLGPYSGCPRLCFTRQDFPLCSVPCVDGAIDWYVLFEPEPAWCPVREERAR